MKKALDTTVVAPRSISGFPEWLPEVKILENRLLNIWFCFIFIDQ